MQRRWACLVTVLGALGAAGCGSSAGVAMSPGPATSVTAPAPTSAAPSAVLPTSGVGDGGTLTVTFRAADAVPGVQLRQLADTTRTAIRAAGFDGTVDVSGDRRIVIRVAHAGHAVQDQVIAASGLVDASAVSLRPVLQCVAGDAQPRVTEPTTLTSSGTESAPTATVDDPTQSAVLPQAGGGRCYVGPAGGTGRVFEPDAEPQLIGGTWGVIVSLRPGAGGVDIWNQLAAACYAGGADCPTRQLAIVVNGRIVSAPTVQQPAFDSATVQITGSFSEAAARALAKIVNAGSVPLHFDVESVATSAG